MPGLIWLDPLNDDEAFPHPEHALDEPDGLLALGGCLSTRRLIRAYRSGIFPWYDSEQPILWWSPNPRTVLWPEQVLVRRSLRKVLRKNQFYISFDTCFEQVVRHCGEPRRGETGSWITPEIIRAYVTLHQLGLAHSVECYLDGVLVGGLYGVSIGRIFFGESMFSHISDASKTALVALARQLQRWHFGPIDCQMHTLHLESMGAQNIPRHQFLRYLDQYCPQPPPERWQIDTDLQIGAGEAQGA